MHELDKRLADLKSSVDSAGNQSDLDAMLAMIHEKEKKAEEREKQFNADYEKYQKIAASQFASDEMKVQAWRILCQTWNVPETTNVGSALSYNDGVVRPIISVSGSVMPMVSIPGGTFQMGSTSGYDNEKPVHTVTVSGFKMGKYEVTQGQYQSVMGTNPSRSYGVGDNNPVYDVSWYDAVKFCNKLSDAAGLERCYNESTWACDFGRNGFRLPTEAEWEYACRAGTETNFYTGNAISSDGRTSADLDRAGWYYGNSGSGTHPVGKKTPNAWGLYDMHGNVWEWCHDWYGSYTPDSQTNPTGPASGSYRVARGGSWDSDARRCRSASRFWISPADSLINLGFRVVRRP